MWETRGELWEEFVWSRRVDYENRETPDGRRSARKHLESAVSVFGKQRERDALHGPRCDHLRISASKFVEDNEWGWSVVVLRGGYLGPRARSGKSRGAVARMAGV